MNAVCFACGHEKEESLERCSQCDVKPMTSNDKVRSVCLSSECLSEKNLVSCSRFIRQHRKLPGFHKKVITKARTIVGEIQNDQPEVKKSVDLSSSYFDFQGLGQEEGETITVHTIGKPPRDGDQPETSASLMGKGKTYQKLQWKLGVDISFDDAEQRATADGELYVQYQWLNGRWIHKYVSKSRFMQLKELESFSAEEKPE